MSLAEINKNIVWFRYQDIGDRLNTKHNECVLNPWYWNGNFRKLGFVFNMLLEDKLIGKETLAEAEMKD